MAKISSTDVARVAYEIEGYGQKFYKHALEITDKPELKKIYQSLYDDEIRHGEIFKRMFGTLEQFEKQAGIVHLDDEYLHTLYDSLVFDEEMFSEIKEKIQTPRDAIEFAMNREKDTVLLFRELSDYLAEHDRGEISIIINEERKHYLRLKKLLDEFK